MVERLVCIVMGQNCEKFIGMALESVKEADTIVYCDGGSKDRTLQILDKYNFNDIDDEGKLHPRSGRIIIRNNYNQEDKEMNGKQRNFYLDYVKKNYSDYWCLAIDCDEVVEDLSEIKEFIQTAKPGVYSPKMRHLISDLAHEDSIKKTHYVLHRLFKISNAVSYPEVEHPVLIPKEGSTCGEVNCTTIWHLAYIPGMWEIKKRYQNHLRKSNMHTPQYLKAWYYGHIFGFYCKKQFNPLELPSIITDEFLINRDELYFENRRKLEVKHYQDAIDWKEFFNLKNCLIFGCGLGQRVYTLNKLDVVTEGRELSKFAVKNRLHEYVKQGDITQPQEEPIKYDLVVAFDVLEHLEPDDLEVSINNMITATNKYILISVPVIGNPALENDPTHKIKQTNEWWINKFTIRGLKHIKTPDNFLYKEQIYIFEV